MNELTSTTPSTELLFPQCINQIKGVVGTKPIPDLEVGLHLLLLVLEALVSLLLLLHARLQVVEDLLQLLLLGGQAGPHLLRLGEQLRLRLQLLRQDALLLRHLEERARNVRGTTRRNHTDRVRAERFPLGITEQNRIRTALRWCLGALECYIYI